MSVYTVKDEATGKKIKFEWNDPDPPTDADIDAILQEASGLQAPATQEQQEYTLGEALKSAVTPETLKQSATQYGKDIARPFYDPVGTAKGLGALGQGIFYKFTPGEQEEEAIPDAVWETLKSQYGDWDAIKRSIAKDPVRVLGDMSGLLMGAGGTVGVMGKVGQTSKLAQTGKAISEIGKILDPISVPLAAARGSAGLAADIPPIKAAKNIRAGGVKHALDDTRSRKLYQSAIKPPKAIASSAKEAADVADFGLKMGVVPTNAGLLKIKKELRKINKDINKALTKATQAGMMVDTTPIVRRLSGLKRYYRDTFGPTLPMRQIDKIIGEFTQKHGMKLTPKEAQRMKTELYKGLQGEYKEIQTRSQTVRKAAEKAAANELMKGLEEIAPDLKNLNPKHGAYQSLKRSVDEIVRAQRSAQIMEGGGILKGIFTKLIDNPQFKAKLAIALRKARTRPHGKGQVARTASYQAGKFGGLVEEVE